MKKRLCEMLAGMLVLVALCGCSQQTPALNGDNADSSGSAATMEITDTSGATQIVLSDNNSKVNGGGAVVKENIITIAKEGTYVVSGNLSDGQLIVDANKESKVTIVLDGAGINCKTSAAVAVLKAKEVELVLKEDTQNLISDGADYSEEALEKDINGAIFSKADLTLEGTGKLIITGNYKHGIISKENLTLCGGIVEITSKDDGIHSKENIVFEEGCDVQITAGDDGVHADGNVTVNSGKINVLASYEGMEGTVVTYNGGTIALVSEDDGINATGTDCKINVNGGIIRVNAGGDGVDSNGSLEINGGELYVSGSVASNNAALDFEERYGAWIHGGTVVATGSSGMVVAMEEDSKQCSAVVHMETTIKGGIPVSIKDSAGNVLAEYTPEKDWQCVVVSTPEMTVGETYTVVAGEASVEVTLESQSTTSGQGGMRGPGGMGGFGGKRDPGNMQMPEDMTWPEGMQRPEDMPFGEGMKTDKGKMQ